jgi:hypothetical protein
MTGSYSVTLADIAAAARKFDAEAGTFKAIMPPAGPSCPDGGDSSVNESLQAVVEAGAALHMQIAGTIALHGARLQQAHDRYQQSEESISRLCTDLAKDASLS